MPNMQALQIFYGSVPVLLAIVAVYFRYLGQSKEELLLLNMILDQLKQIDARLTSLENRVNSIDTRLARVEGHLRLSVDVLTH